MPRRDHHAAGYVDVTIVEFAAHTAYLDPVTGIGYLVLPAAATDVSLDIPGQSSLHAVDRSVALSRLGDRGWALLYDENGEIEHAGVTTDSREALCLYGEPAAAEPTLEDIDCALIALDIAAGLELRRHDDTSTP